MYEPLDESKRQIRLLHLLPGENAELRCTFSLVSLRDNPTYEAISYVWGDTIDPQNIYVEPGERAMPITKNLHSVLRNVRLQQEERVLWADALCINQKDLGERGSQVAIMADIFKNAARVLAYLGDYWDGCELAVEAILQLAENKHVYSYVDGGLSVGGRGLESSDLMNCLARFLDTPWMTRT